MKILLAVIGFLLLTGALALAEIRIVSAEGDIKIRRGAREDWQPAAAGDIVKPEDSMRSGRGSSVVLSVDGVKMLALPEMVIVDCSDLRTLTQEDLLLKLAMEGIRSLPEQKRDGSLTVPRTTTVHGTRSEPAEARRTRSKEGYVYLLNGTKVLHRHGFYATMVLRAKEVFRLAPDLHKRYDVRLMMANAFEKMNLSGEALEEYQGLSKEALSLRERAVVEGKIAELKKKQEG